jgi:TRAP-type C4-dicarboxylate transport system permease small subunit
VFTDSSVLGRMTQALARWMAIAGGIALLGMIVIVVVSVVGRAFIWAGLKPILGDYELISVGMGFAIFAFLPWTHLTRGHALVSLVTDNFSGRINAWILVVTDLLMLCIASFIAWRLYFGMIDKFRYHETTILLGLPMGWAFVAGFVGAVIWALVSIFVLGRSVTDAIAGKAPPKHVGSDH